MKEQGHRRWVAYVGAVGVIGGWLLVSAGGARQAQASILQATYLGGTGLAQALAVAVDPASGDILLAGSDTAADIPGTAGGAQSDYAGAQDGWLARLSPDLRTLKQATYVGGSARDEADAIAIDPTSGDILVAGVTQSSDFPGTAGGLQAHLAGSSDVFVARFSGDLRTLRQATYLGGSGNEEAGLLGIAVDQISGDVVVAGSTPSTDFPGTATGAQPVPGGNKNTDGFVARLTSDLKTLVRATYAGGPGDDALYAVAINPISDEVVVGGWSAFAGLARQYGVVSCYSSDLRTLKGNALLGDTGEHTTVWGLAIDPTNGTVVAAGETTGPLAGVANGAQPKFGGGSSDAFAASFTSDLFPVQATYLGGSDIDGGTVRAAIRVSTHEVLVTGQTMSSDFPATAGGVQPAPAGGGDVFVARLSGNLRTFAQATYLGGSQGDSPSDIALSTAGSEVMVVGLTASTDFPATAGGAQPMIATPPVVGAPGAAFAVRVSAALAADTPTPTATPRSPTPSAMPTGGACIGDCRGTGQVTIDDLIKGVDIALNDAPMSVCAAFDANHDGRVTVDELIEAVGNALNGCR